MSGGVYSDGAAGRLPATIKLYDEDAYLTRFEARVLMVEECGRGSAGGSSDTADIDGDSPEYLIVLDRTAFFPEAGGQTPDRGLLAGGEVTDVQIATGVITHRVRYAADMGKSRGASAYGAPDDAIETQGPPSVGDTVSGAIDWTHRFSNMQQHTGEHICSGIVHRRFGYSNVGFHLSDSIVTMDYDGFLTPEQLREIEREANEAVWRDLPIRAYYPDDDELLRLDYRSKGELEPPIRIVKIEDIDVCACCAPHVLRTGEVGIIKIVSYQKYKSGIRLSILCGGRALMDIQRKQERLEEISHILSAAQERLPEEVARIHRENGELKSELHRQQEEALAARLAAVSEDMADVWLFVPELASNVIRRAVNSLTDTHDGYCGIFYGEGEVRRFIIGVRRSREMAEVRDARDAMKLLSEHFETKGGGSPEMVQGYVCADEDMLKAILYRKRNK